MTLQVFDRVVETSTTTGTGTYTLAGAVTGYRTFQSVLAVGDTAECYAEDVDSNGVPTGSWEVFMGTLATTTTLTRDMIESSSNSGNAVNWSAGTRRIALAVTARMVNQDYGSDLANIKGAPWN